MPAQTVIKLRRGTAAQWTSANPVLAAGEVGIETDTNKFKFGNGTANWAALSYATSGGSSGAVEWADVLNKPSTFAPSSHSHPISQVVNLPETLAGKADTAHTHLLADITDYVEPDSLPTQTGNNGKFLTTNGSAASWATVTIPPGTTVSDTAPSSPTAGQLWWKSDTGVLYIFYDNFWVEAVVGATGATGPAGADGVDGTNGVDAVFQLITAQDFTSSTAVNVNNVFSSAYENYKVIVTYRASTATTMRLRVRTAGTDLSTGNKYFTVGYSYTGTINEGDANQAIIGWADVTGTGGIEFNFFRPFISTSDTAFTIVQSGPRSGSFVYGPFMAGAGVRENRSDTGFTIYPDGGNITGTVRVYGAKNS